MGTAEVSLIVSGLAALGSIAAVVTTYRLGRQRFEHEQRLSDLDTARRVLDDAAAAMLRTESRLSAIRSNLEDYEHTQLDRVRQESSIAVDSAALDDARNELDTLTARLLIRFGSAHELVDVCQSAAGYALEVAVRVEYIAKAYDAADAIRGEHENIEAASRQFGLARQSFALIAFRIAGVELQAFQLADKERRIGDSKPSSS